MISGTKQFVLEFVGYVFRITSFNSVLLELDFILYISKLSIGMLAKRKLLQSSLSEPQRKQPTPFFKSGIQLLLWNYFLLVEIIGLVTRHLITMAI